MSIRKTLIAAIAALAVAWSLWQILLHVTVQFAQVNVRWDPSFAPFRQAAEQRLGLIPIREDDPSVWWYVLTDTSVEKVNAIFATPGVQDVRFLDRATAQPTEFRRVSLAEWLEVRFGFNAHRRLRATGLIPVVLGAVLLALAADREGRRWLVSRVPPLRPSTMGAFRVTLALALFPWVQVRLPEAPPAVATACLASLAAFGVGLVPRAALLVFLSAFVLLSDGRYSHHDMALPLKTLLLLCVVPWGDGLSVDALWRRRHVPDVPGRRYGLAIWIPIMMLGFGYAAAAFAKLDDSGATWLMGGAARYFFIIESPLNAPTDWWRVVARSDTLSVLASAGAVVTEAGIVIAAFWPRVGVRVVAGLAAVALHTGFWLFQGIWWHGFWALLPAFLPWEWLVPARKVTGEAPDGIPRLAVAVLLLVMIQQPLVSFLRIEIGPYVADYGMYANAGWSSKDEFVETMYAQHYPRVPAVRLQPVDDDAALFDRRLSEVDRNGLVREAANRIVAGEALSDRRVEALRRIADDYERRYQAPPPPVRLLTAGWRFDWQAPGFVPDENWTEGPVLEWPSNLADGEQESP